MYASETKKQSPMAPAGGPANVFSVAPTQLVPFVTYFVPVAPPSQALIPVFISSKAV